MAHKRLLRAQEQTRKVKEILRLANTCIRDPDSGIVHITLSRPLLFSSRHPSMDGVPLPHFERRGSVRSLRAGPAEDPAEMRLCIEKLKGESNPKIFKCKMLINQVHVGYMDVR